MLGDLMFIFVCPLLKGDYVESEQEILIGIVCSAYVCWHVLCNVTHSNIGKRGSCQFLGAMATCTHNRLYRQCTHIPSDNAHSAENREQTDHRLSLLFFRN